MDGPIRTLLTATLGAIYKWPMFWEDIDRFKTLSIRGHSFNDGLRLRRCRVLAIFIAMYITTLEVLPVDLSPGFLHALLQGAHALDGTDEQELWISIWGSDVAAVLAQWPRDPTAPVPYTVPSMRAMITEYLNIEVRYHSTLLLRN